MSAMTKTMLRKDVPLGARFKYLTGPLTGNEYIVQDPGTGKFCSATNPAPPERLNDCVEVYDLPEEPVAPPEPETLVRDKTMERLTLLRASDLHWLIRSSRKELSRRCQERARLLAAMQGMANVMAGVAWALACRQSLRRSKGHTPDTGKAPASGEMWLIHEILYAVRHEVKERSWSPLGAQNANDVLRWLKVELQRKPPREDVAVQFAVKMASPTYAAVHFEPPRSGAW